MKKYTINLFEPHIKTILEALHKQSIDLRLQDFITLQVQLQDKNDELSRLHLDYDKHLASYEDRAMQQRAQH